MIIAKKSLIFSVLLVGILGVTEVVSIKKGKGRRLQQRPFAPAYHNVPFSQPRIPSYHTIPSSYPTPPALRQPPARPVAPRPGIVVFGVGPQSLQIPNHYSNYAPAPQQTKPIVPAPAYAPAPQQTKPIVPAPAYAPAPQQTKPIVPTPAYAPPTAVVTRTPPRNQPAISNYAPPVHYQQTVEQTRYHSQPIQPTYPVQSPQYGNRYPVAQPGNYQQPSAQVVAVSAPIPVTKQQVSIPTYVAPAKSTVYGSAYVDNSASYHASDSYTRGEASKPVESIPASYQSPAKHPQENYGTAPTVSYISNPTAIYTETKAKQSIGAYAIETPKIKESQSSYSTPAPNVKYSTEVPYSTIESKPTSGSYDKHSNSEKSKADKDQYKKPVYPASQSYKETESLSHGEKKKEIDSSSLPYSKVEAKPVSQPSKQDEYKVSKQEDSKLKAPAYSIAESHKKAEYKEEKKEQVSVYAKSETASKDQSYQSHTQTEKTYDNKDKPQTSAYPTSQTYKEEDSKSYGEQKKKVEESSLSYSAVESKPEIESSKQNAYQSSTEDKVKVSSYPTSQKYKEVESPKEVQDYKEQDHAVYQPTSASESYVKNSDSYKEEKQPKKPAAPTHSYKTVESQSKPEDDKKHYKAEHIPSKPASVPSYKTYPSIATVTQEPSKYHESKTYEPNYPSGYPAPNAPVKEVNSYSKPNLDETNLPSHQYSTSYATTTKVPIIQSEDKVKVSPSQDYKEVESQKDIQHYKKQESAVYDHKPVSDSYTKHSAAYVEESQPQKPVISATPSYKKDDSALKTEYKQKHYEAEYSSSKPASVSTYDKPISTLLVTEETSKYHETYPKAYETKDLSVSQAPKSSLKEVNTYSKQKSEGESNRYSLPVYSTTTSRPLHHYSTESTATRKVPTIPIEDKVKVPAYTPFKNNKEVETLKEVQDYKKQEAAAYEHKPVGNSYIQHSASYVEESQHPKLAVSTSVSHNKDESQPSSEYKQTHYEAEYSPSKAAPVPTYEKYPSTSAVTQEPSKYNESNSKDYESKYPSVSPVNKSPVQEVNTSSKPTSDESKHHNLHAYSTTTSFPSYHHSTGYTTTTKAPAISYEDKPKTYYTTTPKYQEYSTSAKVVTYNPPAYKSTVEYAPVATTPRQNEDYREQYSSEKDTHTKAGAPVAVETSYGTPTPTANYNVKANDRVYVVAEPDNTAETYQKKEPVPSYPSYPNPSVDEKLSSDKQVVNQYGPSDRGYNSESSDTANKPSYEGRSASSSASDLPTYNRKPIKEADSLTSTVEGAKNSGSYSHDGVKGDYSAIPGKPEIDYPIYSELPNNKFNCSEQQLPGYYADTSARCQVFHICLGDRQWSFLCPNGTIFSQQHFVCVWWYDFDCSKAPALFELNEKLFIIPLAKQALDYGAEQRTKPSNSENSEGTGKQYDELTNQKERPFSPGSY
ncbi:adhesive plaque matrix protein-like [Daphnia carinata]|uniref:adhesive plaque matrix protein-like n=1 Tax=Daphnia carinata TaxID=120202 RepID=UPI00257B4811|nr:adhesive plaque matrix protein-like [Daphnia carinata]